MKKNVVIWLSISCFIISLLLVGFSIEIQRIYAQDTIYIRADGRIEPETAPISTLDNVTYTLTDNIMESIVIERSNIILDGTGYTVQGAGGLRGIDLNSIQNITIKNICIQGFYYGISINLCSQITITESNITMNAYDGVNIVQSALNNISQNSISNNGNDGLKLLNFSNNNAIAKNIITLNNDDGIQLTDSPQNTISENTISQNKDVGIYTFNSSNTSVIGNTVTNNRDGLVMTSSLSSKVNNNTVNSNTLRGVSLSSSSDSIFEDNVIDGNYDGVYAYQSSKNVFSENEIKGNSEYGIWLDFSPNSTLSLNHITENNDVGIYVRFSSNSIVSDNTINNCNYGISLSGSSNNSIIGNLLANNSNGIDLAFSSTNNQIYHNNFVNNTQQASSTSAVAWENGLEGNYWSDYSGSDADLDGIGDSPYVIDVGNDDDFPLMGMFNSFETPLGYRVNVISNSTIDYFNYSRLPSNVLITMHFSTMTPSQTAGLCRIAIPHFVMTEPYNITINGTQPNYVNYTIYDNETYRWIYFNYNHSTLVVLIQGIETTPPEISIVSPINMTYTASDIPLVFTVKETASWMGYSLDGQANVTVLGNTTLLGLVDGIHNIVVYANDTFGNMASSNVVYFSVDTKPPTVIVISPLNQTYSTDSIMLTFTLDELTSWVGYSLDGQTNITILGNTTLFDLTDGNHNVIVFATDEAGNTGSSTLIYFSVDTTPPNITNVSQYPPADNVQPYDRVSINATVVDNLSEVSTVILNYTTNNGTWFSEEMHHLEGNVWKATIPGFSYCTTVNYTITAIDEVGNSIAHEEAYITQYHVVPEFSSHVYLLLFVNAVLILVALHRMKRTMRKNS
ncbi:right-handed parallel beta-helix repeat-containing protein [Candidatus Bathyarchaeota archaeon]|nr:right-handed parallel beta-helix repeat-containing protein [Candidatus Bathyarchaeota archaeon]